MIAGVRTAYEHIVLDRSMATRAWRGRGIGNLLGQPPRFHARVAQLIEELDT